MDWNRLLDLIERFVVIEERKLMLTIEQLKVRNMLETRAVAAQEQQAKGLRVSGDLRGDITHRQPTPEAG